jgi:hypothetical protein
MRKVIPLASVIAMVGALSAAVAPSSAAATATRITCNSREYNPTPTQLSGVVFQLTNCSKPFGHGVVSASYSSTFNQATSGGTEQGRWTKWFLTGTLHGRYTGNYQFTSNTDETVKNTITVLGGTGAFTGVQGTGSESCASTNAGATFTCTEVLDLTGL